MNQIRIRIAYIRQCTELIDYVIVCQKKNENVNKRILHYTHPLALELLSAAYAKDRHYRGSWNNRAYNVVDFNPRNKSLLEVIPDAVVIKRGGCYPATKNNTCVCDVLFYSQRYKRFEPVHTIYDSKKELYYMTLNAYRCFIQEHGNPKVITVPEESKLDGLDNGNIQLNSQSILNLWGYSTNASLGISRSERWEILREIVDLELLQVQDVVGLLDFLITFNGKKTSNSEALLKWQEDLSMISEYKICPERFMILE